MTWRTLGNRDILGVSKVSQPPESEFFIMKIEFPMYVVRAHASQILCALILIRVSPPFDDLEIVELGTTDQPKELRIGTTLSPDERESLVKLLRPYLDVFAWSYEDMSGLDLFIV